MRFFPILVALAASTLFLTPAPGALDTTEGSEHGLWARGRGSVVVARFRGVTALPPDPRRGATHRAKLEPLATIAGQFDPSARTSIELLIAVDVQGVTSCIRKLPADGSIVLAMIYPDERASDSVPPVMWASSSICRFMPEHSGLIAVDGLGDIRVGETLARVRAARTRPDPDSPEGRAESRAALEREMREISEKKK